MSKKTKDDLAILHIVYKQTDLWLSTDGKADRELILEYLREIYAELEDYISKDRLFLSTLHCHYVHDDAPFIVKQMAECARLVDVGPMAGVAGAIAEQIGGRLSNLYSKIICNNGGDIYYKSPCKQQFLLMAPGSPFDERIMLHCPPAPLGKGLCTSSGVSGHSINMGRAYAVTILAESACLADVWVTAVSNTIIAADDIEKGIAMCQGEKGIEGVIILVDDSLGIWGNITISGVE